jgi:hypothetical protein
MDCPTARYLLDEYARSTAEYVEAANMLSCLAGSHEHFADAQECAKQTHTRCKLARLALERHRAEHNCRVKTAADKS